ncbi:MAG: hypothetical protein AAFY17_06430 [Cyanobacteria bacterium J06642_11]
MATRWPLGLPVVVSLGLWTTPAKAASITLGDFTFSEAAGDFIITGGEVTPDVFRIFQDVTGPDIDLFMSIEGLLDSDFLGFRFESVLTNLTNTPWVFFDHELQEELGTPSSEQDGLSFAQKLQAFRPFTSSAFSVVDEVTDVRDFVNFSDGVVNPNETVSFRYVILDNDPNDTFFLRQRPNFAPGGVGVVNPDPVVPPDAPSPVTEPDAETDPEEADPIVVSEVIVDPVTESSDQTKVPEPGVSLGLLGLLGLKGLLKHRR